MKRKAPSQEESSTKKIHGDTKAAPALAVMQKHAHVTLERIEKFLSPIYFADVNLCADLVKHRANDAIQLQVASFTNRVTFEEAVRAKFMPAKVGESFGPTWPTHWFLLEAKVPEGWVGERVDLIWDSNSEAMVWDEKGNTLQALTGGKDDNRRLEFTLLSCAKGGETLGYYVEMASNGLFGAGKDGMINAPDLKRTFLLATAELVVPNMRVVQLYEDLSILYSFAKDFPEGSLRKKQALYVANAAVNAYLPGDPSSVLAAGKIVEDFFKDTNGTSQHAVTAIGHCHIDTAWLWPYDETKRKCARSWTTQCDLIDKYPGYKFIASQAQQFEWVEQMYPSLFKRIQQKVKEGTFVVTGSTWVEMDCNLPSGESFVRQFVFGQRYFESRFGQKSKIFWLPDTFGYNSQLPQIIKQGGAEYFLTQKLSWNLINKFPHTTFFWKGLDGSKVLTHFPPSDTYNAHVTVRETMMCVTNHKDVDRSNRSMMLFGHGDGGGGPTWDMIHRAQRFANLDGLPKIEIRSPDFFFKGVNEQDADRLITWDGELYFELHRGTYTSQANNKLQNRKNEYALQSFEALLAIDLINGHQVPKATTDELDRLWKLLLLNQFHDVIPGTSIGEVFDDSRKHYEDISASLRLLGNQRWQVITGKKTILAGASPGSLSPAGYLLFNSNPFTFSGYVQLGPVQRKVSLAPYSIQYHSVQDLDTVNTGKDHSVKVSSAPASHSLENNLVLAQFDGYGRLVRFYDKANEREILEPGSFGNIFKFYEDIPLFWDAWDVEVYHLEKGWETNQIGATVQVDPASSSSIGKLRFNLQLSEKSRLECTVSLASDSSLLKFDCEVDWDENRRFLKVEFPLNIRSDHATYEVQYGLLRRPTHYNTSWDLAKFEVCGHKFADLSEYGYGVALLNDCKFGYAARGNVLALSLLRSPKAPDDRCDIGHHQFQYALFPHRGSFESSRVVEEARLFNVPPQIIPMAEPVPEGRQPMGSYFRLEGASNLVLDTLKPSDTEASSVILRVYESLGGRGGAYIVSDRVKITKAVLCDFFENPHGQFACDENGRVKITFTPFQILTIKVSWTNK